MHGILLTQEEILAFMNFIQKRNIYIGCLSKMNRVTTTSWLLWMGNSLQRHIMLECRTMSGSGFLNRWPGIAFEQSWHAHIFRMDGVLTLAFKPTAKAIQDYCIYDHIRGINFRMCIQWRIGVIQMFLFLYRRMVSALKLIGSRRFSHGKLRAYSSF